MKTDNLRVILCANGKGVRWVGFKQTKKCLAEVKGESIIHRTIRQIDTLIHPECGIHVVGKDNALAPIPAILIPPSTTFNPLPGTCFGESATAFDPEAKMDHLVLMGDIWWPNYGIEQLHDLGDDRIEFFGHWNATQSHNGEIFGVHIPAHLSLSWCDALFHVKHHALHDISQGWQVYRYLHNIPLDSNERVGDWLEITEDATDIDFPHEYFELRRRAHTIIKNESK